MKIVVTDGYTLNPGDLDWEALGQFGELTVYDRTAPGEVLARCGEASVILSNKVVFSGDTLARLPRLQLICVLATGYNVIDTEAARNLGITVCNVPGYGTASVAQHTFALLLELTNQVGRHAASVARHDWENAKDWCYTLAPITELQGKKLGIVGMGRIGSQVARIAGAFGMEVSYYNRTPRHPGLGQPTDLVTLFATSDIISLHCPLTPENEAFVNKKLLGRMKPTAFLINTSRGQLIQEDDLADALNQGKLAGAALDVLSVEPPPPANPLLQARHCLITPHNAWMSREARSRILDITAQNIAAFLNKTPRNRVA